MKLHLPALGGLLTTIVGLAGSPLVSNVIPAHWAAAIVAVGAAVQAVTKAIQHQDPAP